MVSLFWRPTTKILAPAAKPVKAGALPNTQAVHVETIEMDVLAKPSKHKHAKRQAALSPPLTRPTPPGAARDRERDAAVRELWDGSWIGGL